MACTDSKEKFARDFVAAWTKVMNLDRFERRLRALRKRSDKNKRAAERPPFFVPLNRDHAPSVPAFAAA